MPTDQLEIGDLFDGKYRVDAKLGEGGMAVVYRVTKVGDVATQHALKLIRLPSFPSEEALGVAKARFRQEAGIQARLRSPHIVGIHRYDVAADGTPYLLMELLEGEDLGAVLRRCGHLPWKTALDVVCQTALALTALHSAGMVHRDLSPGNLFLVRQGEQLPEAEVFVKLLDFGIAKSAQVGASPLTTDPALRIGNPPYMAPECILRKPRRKAGNGADSQTDGEWFDARADQFSLGSILFEMLAGYRAFLPTGDDPSQAFGMVLNADPLSYKDLPPVFTPALREVLGRAFRKDPAERYPSVAEFVAALRSLEPVRETVVPLPLPPTAGNVLTVQLALWIGLAFIVVILCIIAYERDLAAWLSPAPRTAVIDFPRRPPEVDRWPEPSSPDLQSEPVDLGLAPSVDASLSSAPDLALHVISPPPRSPPSSSRSARCSIEHSYQNSREKEDAAPALEVFRKVIGDCLHKCSAPQPQIEIRTMKELHASGYSSPTENIRLSRCLNDAMPKGKVLPKRTIVTRVK